VQNSDLVSQLVDASQWVETSWSLNGTMVTKIISSLSVIVGIWLLYYFAQRSINNRIDDARQLYYWRKTLSTIAIITGAVLLGFLWLPSVQSWGTFFGLVSAGIVIALQQPITNLAGWLFIVWRRPFEAGDRIQIGDRRGDVIDVRMFQFSLLEIGEWVDADQSTGRILHIPNAHIFSRSMANYSAGFKYIWNEIPVLITFDSNWEKGKGILQDIAQQRAEHLSSFAQQEVRRAARRFMIYYPTLTPIVYTSVRDSGVLLTIRYLSEPRRRRTTAQEIWEDILRRFAEHPDLEFAYPSQHIYAQWTQPQDAAGPDVLTEGSAGTRQGA
jgi:small-conductance mechanosensitive channel